MLRALRYDELEIGQTYLYKNKRVDNSIGDISNTISPLGMYKATVIGKYPHHMVLNITIDQSTMRNTRGIFSNAKPYNWSVDNLDVGKSERFYVEVDDGN